MRTTWKLAAEAEEATKLLRCLRKEGVGLGEMEATITKQLKAKKSGKGGYKRRGELLGTMFAEKLDDSYITEVKRRRRRAVDRQKLEVMLGGSRDKKCKATIKELKK